MSSKASIERKQQKRERNKAGDKAHKEEAWNKGKFIKENHNGGYYSLEYTKELGNRLYKKFKALGNTLKDTEEDREKAIQVFREYRIIIRDYLLKHNPDIQYGEDIKNYYYLIYLYETYQDNPENLISML